MRGILEVRVYQGTVLLEIHRTTLPKPKHLVWVSGIHRFHPLAGGIGQKYHGGMCRVVRAGGHGEFERIELENAIAWGYKPCHLSECES
jgi:hypothetical protein